MKISVKLVYVVLALLAQAQHTFAQYFNKLHDCDSTYDYGMDVFLQPGGNYFVLGEIQKINTSHIQLFRAVISSNGDTLSNKKILDLDSTSIYLGDPGAAIQLSDGSYAIPGSLMKWLVGGNRCFGSFIKLKPDGDIQFIKTYTDTSKHADVMHCIALMPDGGYLIGGERGKNDFMARSAALLIRTDSLGDTLWTKTYSKIATQSAIVNTVIPLPDGRIVLGAQSRFYRWDSSYHWAYNHDSPWFLLLDSSGNVIRDTVYGIFFFGGGRLYKDKYGGYVHVGAIDSMIDTLDPNDYVNFPNYLTHLDTNFQVEWITRLPYSETFGHRYTLKVTQLHDGNFITQQTAVVTTSTRYLAIGWAAKFDRLGNIIWNHFYLNDSFNHSYFYDVAERPDGGLVFIGYSYKNGIPASHEYYDMWLVGVDSNGCELPGGCSTNLWPAGTTSPVPSEGGVTVYPNPSTGKMTVRVPMEGVFMVHDLKGQLVREYRLGKGETEISLPSGIAPGVYFGRYVTEFGVETVRVIVNY